MRFLRFSVNNTASWGVINNDDIIDLGSRFGGSLHQVISDNQLESMANKTQGLTVDYHAADIVYLPPIQNPEKIACIGVNYANRNAEYKDGSEPAKFPSLFMRTPDSLTGHNAPILRPPESVQLDYEGEIVIIIGKGGRRITEDKAYEHIAGLTIMNEGTLRDWIRHAKFNVTQGKNFVHSGAIGPWMVSADEFSAEQYENMQVSTHVNGELRQNDTTANLMFPFRYIISYLSTFYQLKPGDIIATGTPNGAGARFDPPRWLVPGDTVTIKVEGVGSLENKVEDELVD